MKYLGNKSRLLDFIDDSMKVAGLPQNGVFIDLFSGTGSVGKYFKNKGFKVISNDIMTYSYIAQYVLIKINVVPNFNSLTDKGLLGAINLINSQNSSKGYIFDNFAPGGSFGRQYFSNENAMKIDGMRDFIHELKKSNKITLDEYYILVNSLVDAADFVANISGTYGAYLKIWRSMALKSINLLPPNITNNGIENEVYQDDANELISKITGDILYIDPPYNQRQYAPNFHMLETLSIWDKPTLYGKTGQRDYSQKKSAYSQVSGAFKAFRDLIKKANVKYIVLSYNNEGIIPHDEIKKTLSEKGELQEFITDYRRFRTERNHEKRQYKDVNDRVTEHLFIVKVK